MVHAARSDAKSAGLGADAASDAVRIRLFDADRTDRELTLDEALAAKVSARDRKSVV